MLPTMPTQKKVIVIRNEIVYLPKQDRFTF